MLVQAGQSPGGPAHGSFRPRTVLMSQLPLTTSPSPGGCGGAVGGGPAFRTSPTGGAPSHHDALGLWNCNNEARAAAAGRSPAWRDALGIGGMLPQPATAAREGATAGPAAVAKMEADATDEGGQGDGASWPWSPGMVLSIDQNKWKALLAAKDPAEGDA